MKITQRRHTVSCQAVVSCAMCPATLTLVDVTGPREARKEAEAQYDWIGIGPGGFDMVCPEHDVPCPHCERPMSRELALTTRRTLRARQRRREAEWKAR